MTAEVFGSCYPFFMIVNRLHPLFLIRIAERPLAVAHDEHRGDAFAIGPRFHFLEVSHIFGFVHEELIDIFHRINAMFFGLNGKV